MFSRYRLPQLITSIVLLALASAFGQTGPALIGSGDTPPLVVVAPGEVTTLQVLGLKTILSAASPVITQLSVLVNQYPPTGKLSFTAPILSVSQGELCSDLASTTPDCLVTLITVQIPFELVFAANSHAPPIRSEIVITENGASSKAFRIAVTTNNIHVLTGCHDILAAAAPCVTHADGAVVSWYSPAHAGETIVIYAFGLGVTTPPVKTGEKTPSPAPTVGSPAPFPVAVEFDFTPNARPSAQSGYAGNPGNYRNGVAQFAGLTPGFVGLYQVNVTLPDKFPPIPACGSDEYYVTSNLMVNISLGSSDGAPICVQPM